MSPCEYDLTKETKSRWEISYATDFIFLILPFNVDCHSVSYEHEIPKIGYDGKKATRMEGQRKFIVSFIQSITQGLSVSLN